MMIVWHLLLDWDDGTTPLTWREISARLLRAGFRVRAAMRRPSSSGKGWHVKIALQPPPRSECETVALQAILESDPYREAYNLGRVRVLSGTSNFWRERWNVLYRRTLSR